MLLQWNAKPSALPALAVAALIGGPAVAAPLSAARHRQALEEQRRRHAAGEGVDSQRSPPPPDARLIGASPCEATKPSTSAPQTPFDVGPAANLPPARFDPASKGFVLAQDRVPPRRSLLHRGPFDALAPPPA